MATSTSSIFDLKSSVSTTSSSDIEGYFDDSDDDNDVEDCFYSLDIKNIGIIPSELTLSQEIKSALIRIRNTFNNVINKKGKHEIEVDFGEFLETARLYFFPSGSSLRSFIDDCGEKDHQIMNPTTRMNVMKFVLKISLLNRGEFDSLDNLLSLSWIAEVLDDSISLFKNDPSLESLFQELKRDEKTLLLHKVKKVSTIIWLIENGASIEGNLDYKVPSVEIEIYRNFWFFPVILNNFSTEDPDFFKLIETICKKFDVNRQLELSEDLSVTYLGFVKRFYSNQTSLIDLLIHLGAK